MSAAANHPMIFLLSIAALFFQFISSQMILNSTQLFTLDSGFSNCGLVVTSNITMITCQSMAYLISSNDLALKSNASETQMQQVVSCARESQESGNSSGFTQKGITYLINSNQVYRASLNATTNMPKTQMLFTIPIDLTDPNVPQISDVIVCDNFTIVMYNNQSVGSYLRPKTLGGSAVNSKSGSLSIASNTFNTIYSFAPILLLNGDRPTSNQSMHLFVTLNPLSSNVLSQYQIVQVYSGLLVVDIQIKLVQTITQIASTVSAISVSQGYILVGCSSCNLYQGHVDIYNRSSVTLAKLGAVNGASNNQMLGNDIVMLSSSATMGFAQFQIGSNSGGVLSSRQYYVNILRLITSINITTNATTFSYDFQTQVVSGLVSANIQSSLQVGVIRGEQLILKYGYSSLLFGVTICNFQKSYNQTDRTCSQCSNNGVNTQMQAISPCTSCANYKTSLTNLTTLFNQSIYNYGCIISPIQQAAAIASVNSTTVNITTSIVNGTNTTSTVAVKVNTTVNSTSNVTTTNVTQANSTSTNVTQANVTSAKVTSTNVTSTNVTSSNVTSTNVTIKPTTQNVTVNQTAIVTSKNATTTTNSTTNSTTTTINNQTTPSNNQTSNKTNATTNSTSNSSNVVPVNSTNSTNNITSKNQTTNSSVPIIIKPDNSSSTNITNATATVIPNTIPPSPQPETNSTTTNDNKTEGDSQSISTQVLIPAVIVSVVVALVIVSCLIWCYLKKKARLQKLKENGVKENRSKVYEQGSEDGSKNLPSKFETRIGHTNENLRAETAFDTGRQLDDLQQPDQNLFISPTDGILGTYNSETLDREVQREVAHIQSFFLRGTDTQADDLDDHDLESHAPQTRTSKLQKQQQDHCSEFATNFSGKKQEDEAPLSPRRRKVVPRRKHKTGKQGLFADISTGSANADISVDSNEENQNKQNINDNPYQDALSTDRTAQGTDRQLFKKSGRKSDQV